jgi:hypothetical protein
VAPWDDTAPAAVRLDGRRDGPPEDCGGLGCSVGTVKSATSRGMARLRELSNGPLAAATYREGTQR